MYQHTVIVGNVGRDAELRTTQTGIPVCDFSVAVNRRWTDRNTGELRESTTWFRVTCWRKLAETCAQYVRKGMQVLCTGDLDASGWVDADGNVRAQIELTANDVKFLNRANGNGNKNADNNPPFDAADIPF